MNCPSGAHAGYAIPSGSFTQSDHFPVAKSYNDSLVDRREKFIPARRRPSGDQRGLNRPADPGTTETWRVVRSMILMSESLVVSVMRENASRPPSGDHIGSPSAASCGSNSSGVPPCAEMTKIFQGFPTCADMNAIFVPSGDHRGNAVAFGGYVNWSLPLPSVRPTHSV